MAGIAGNIGWVAAKKQVGYGVPHAGPPTHLWPLAGGNAAPTADINRLQETDSSRDVGVTYVSQRATAGQFTIYVRDNNIDFWIAAALGAVADAGAVNFTHTITPANALPYFTIWKSIGDLLWEKYEDCVVDEVTLSADAGEALQAQVSFRGRASTRLAVDPNIAWALSLESGAAYTYNEATVTLTGAPTSLCSSFEWGINNNLDVQQTNAMVPYDLVPGRREISVGFDLIFTSLAEYNSFHYAAAGFTAFRTDVYETDLRFAFTKTANNSFYLDANKVAYEEFPVEFQPDGDPIVVSARGGANRDTPSIMTAEVKNQKATTW